MGWASFESTLDLSRKLSQNQGDGQTLRSGANSGYQALLSSPALESGYEARIDTYTQGQTD